MTSEQIRKHWHVVEESPEWAIYDGRCPKTEEYYYGLVAHGFDSREKAEQYIRDAAGGTVRIAWSAPAAAF